MNIAIKLWGSWMVMVIPMLIVLTVMPDEFGNYRFPRFASLLMYLVVAPIVIGIIAVLIYVLWMIWK